ncbi:TRAP transporter large permease [Pseudooceanicola sediminis]|uniref:TRAP transporter large permease protein n=1 Tax=Pseudooceanicola sediminis TaxID=2211117 RepID=A0A399IW83_9RHOB|nr:TRAP transporter large permease [Pseudooceanicola sediminis]KAA2314931.1 TRAP transporter large permease [Puniceibacterium sp. HSS470]RII37301.1 TRAP transporter large permease [Pseudooceanicola sediminis]|tara:strand:+ start:25812 stop:27107 length:1296 start_codon:yes stop_codon:yes gene_type:complete
MLIGLFVALLLMIFLGIPVILSLGLVGLAGILIVPDLALPLYPQKMFSSLDSFSLLAMPYFILAGELMSRGGISRKLVDFAETVVGHMRGGLAQANIVSSMIFAGVSGSSTADTSAVGSVLIPAMKEKGYPAGYAAAITATSSTIGAIIPPSMTMIVYGALASVSVGGLFLAGIIPGILVGLALMSVVYIQSLSVSRHPELQKSGQRFSLMRCLRSLVDVWAALVAPVIIVAGILGGVFTATESGVVACVFAFLVSFFLYRTITLRDLPQIFVQAAITTAMVLGIVGIASGFGWLLSYLNFNQMILAAIMATTQDPTAVFLLLVAVMLILTMFVDSMAVLIITVPIAVHIGHAVGINDLQLGLALVMATQIGSTTPPVAVLLFVASSIAKCPYSETVRYSWSFIAAEIVALLLVVFFEPLTVAIPSYVFGN